MIYSIEHFSLNERDVFMTGGFVHKIDENGEKISIRNNKTWMFNGDIWNEKAPMTIPRDRPACSVINMPNGEVSKRNVDFLDMSSLD